jgi:hypothetical protein
LTPSDDDVGLSAVAARAFTAADNSLVLSQFRVKLFGHPGAAERSRAPAKNRISPVEKE